MFQKGDFLHIGYYHYGQCFSGSLQGIRFRLERSHLEDVHFKSLEEKMQASLKVILWPEPFCFETTKEEFKLVREFAYTDQGLEEAMAYVNQMPGSREWGAFLEKAAFI